MLRIQSEAAEELGQIVQYLEHRGGGLSFAKTPSGGQGR